MQLTPFTKTDWYGYAGCESFPFGNPPLIGHITVDGADTDIIVDANGVALVVFNGDADPIMWTCDRAGLAARFMFLLGLVNEVVPGFSSASLPDHGFTRDWDR